MNNNFKSNIESLGKSEALLSILDEYVIFSKTNKYGKITFASAGFCKISGYREEELIGNSHNLLRSEDTPDELFLDLWMTIRSGQKWHGEIKNKKKDGSYYWVDATIMCEKNEEGEIIGYNALRYEITNRKKLQELNSTLQVRIKNEVEQNRIKDQHLMQQTKAAQMGEMMDAVAHQWKQPLTVISILAQTLNTKVSMKGNAEPEYVKKKTDDIQMQIHHMLDTIDTFRKFFRLNETFEHFKVSELIESGIEIVKNQISSNKLDIKIEGNDEAKIYCIKSEFIHTIINFIINSKDAFEENKIENKKIVFNISNKGKKIVLKIYDNAGGIPEYALRNIFDANFTTKREGKGTGIGLYMTKQIFEKIGAQIEASNIEINGEQGACFIITI
ncbi:MAG TPA: PAS domain S-box protein [Arcobacter sp.]|jgi:PAS domain S-box-containing protein|nr:PAS domain S-box protein [Arcobacter sp.]